MKHLITTAVLLFSMTAFAQVGINNTSPKATLDITAKTSGTKPEGLIIPQLAGNDIRTATTAGVYGTNQKGLIIFASSADTNPTSATANITTAGYYYFDGSIWQKIVSGNTPNLYNTDGVLTGTRTVNTAGNPLKVSGGGQLIVQNADNSGKIRLTPSDASHTGFMEVIKGDNTRLGYIGWDNTNVLYNAENGANHVFSGGNMGVGTDYAVDKLYVAASTNRQGATVTNTTTTAGTVTRLGIGGGIPTWGAINYTNIDNASDSRMSLGTYEGLEFLTVKTGGTTLGNVGIGTIAPQRVLHVNANNTSIRFENLPSLSTGTSSTGLVVDANGDIYKNSTTSTEGQILRIGLNEVTYNAGSESSLRFSLHNSAAEMDIASNGASNFINTINGCTISENVTLTAGYGTPSRTTDRIALQPGVYKVQARVWGNFASVNNGNNTLMIKAIVGNNEYSLVNYSSTSGSYGVGYFDDYIIIDTPQSIDFTVYPTNNNFFVGSRATPGLGQSYRSLIMIQRLR
ncbi:hypothetical protein [Flavobacterium sp. B17]|uniref:hypothetical protein n=1 Tax=Flavobacterium sp. B17 TaxID=95618 RepID=UPI00034615EE|nr:hypothetical protein [Flavobacterium sp. B17]